MITGSPSVRRRFVEVPGGQVHLRYGGEHRDRVPVVMFHASPASSKMLEPLLRCFAETRPVFVPDTLGNGDSSPPPGEAPAFDTFVGAHVAALDALGLDRVDLYGTHTGANIACEIAIRHPGRVRRIILDGVSLYGEAERADMLAHYAPPVVRSCPTAWCRIGYINALSGKVGRSCQAATAGSLTMGSSLNSAMVSSVM